MMRLALPVALTLLGCARGIVDEAEGSRTITDTDPTPPAEEPTPARRISAEAPPAGSANAVFDDARGDVTASDGADITRISVAQDRDAMLEVVVETSGVGNLDLYIDSDLVRDTGPDGYDVRVSASAATGAADLWFQEGGTWTAASPPTFTASFRDGKLVVRIHRRYLGPEGSRGPIGIAAGTSVDQAPNGAPAERFVYRPL